MSTQFSLFFSENSKEKQLTIFFFAPFQKHGSSWSLLVFPGCKSASSCEGSFNLLKVPSAPVCKLLPVHLTNIRHLLLVSEAIFFFLVPLLQKWIASHVSHHKEARRKPVKKSMTLPMTPLFNQECLVCPVLCCLFSQLLA